MSTVKVGIKDAVVALACVGRSVMRAKAVPYTATVQCCTWIYVGVQDRQFADRQFADRHMADRQFADR